MNYQKEYSRTDPGCIVFMVAQSSSMLAGIAGGPRPKMNFAATALNRYIGLLVSACERGDEKPRHWFDVGLIGYTTDRTGTPVVGSAWGGALAGRELVGIPDLYDHPLDVVKRTRDEFRDDETGGIREVQVEINFPVWYRPPGRERMFGSPMCAAFRYAHRVVSEWVTAHPNSFPPLVIHLTDGKPTDGAPEAADQLKALSTSDGDLLLCNCHLSSDPDEPVFLPTDEGQLPDPGRALFWMSSLLPDVLRVRADRKGISAPPGCRMTASNADAVSLFKMIDIGSEEMADNALPMHLR